MLIKDSIEQTAPVSIESNSLDILAEDGRPLFSITLNKDGGIDVHTYMVCPPAAGMYLNEEEVLKKGYF